MTNHVLTRHDFEQMLRSVCLSCGHARPTGQWGYCAGCIEDMRAEHDEARLEERDIREGTE